jgi:RNA polymerase sigma-70 factor (ECF subfamily)
MVEDWKGLLDTVREVLVRRGRSAEDADDLMQEAWLRFAVYEARGEVLCAEALLTRVVLNLAASADRARAARGEQVALEELSLLDAAPGIEAVVLARERLRRLDFCLRRLRRKNRAVFMDVRVGGMSFAEAAQAHGMSVRGVEQHVAEATGRLLRWMERWRR